MKLHVENRSLDKLRASLLYIGIITVVTIVIWVSVSIYTSYSKVTIDPMIQAVIKPINPSLDNQVLVGYSNSRVRPPEQFQIVSVVKEGNQVTQVLINPYDLATPKPKVIESPIASKSASISSELTP